MHFSDYSTGKSQTKDGGVTGAEVTRNRYHGEESCTKNCAQERDSRRLEVRTAVRELTGNHDLNNDQRLQRDGRC